VTFWIYIVPDLLDGSIGLDQKSAAHNSQERFPQKHLHAARTVGFDGLKFRIAEEREIQLLLGLELGLCFDGIGAATENDRSSFVKLVLCVAKLGRFGNSTRSLGFRKKIEHHPFPA
jgi:hypothetical protein